MTFNVFQLQNGDRTTLRAFVNADNPTTRTTDNFETVFRHLRDINDKVTFIGEYDNVTVADRYEEKTVSIKGDYRATAWTPIGDNWNGWELPFFTRSQADKVMNAMNADDDNAFKVTFDKTTDSYVVYADGGETSAFDGEDRIINGVLRHVYPLGASDWIWSDHHNDS